MLLRNDNSKGDRKMSEIKLLLATEISKHLPDRDTSGYVKKSFYGHIKVPYYLSEYDK